MVERPHTINLVMFENAFNLRDFGANNYYLRATFNEAPIKTFLCRVDPYLVQRIRHVLGNVPCGFFQKKVNDTPNRIKKLIEAKGAQIEFEIIFFKKFVSNEILIFI